MAAGGFVGTPGAEPGEVTVGDTADAVAGAELKGDGQTVTYKDSAKNASYTLTCQVRGR